MTTIDVRCVWASRGVQNGECESDVSTIFLHVANSYALTRGTLPILIPLSLTPPPFLISAIQRLLYVPVVVDQSKGTRPTQRHPGACE